MRDAFISTLTDRAAVDDRLCLVTGDLGFGVLTDYARRFPKQYLNVGVAEQAMTGIAAGLAAEGRTVVTYSIGNFPTLRCLEQIRNDVCYHKANVKIVAVGGGMSYGPLGVTHHATEDIAIMRSLPGMTVLVPSDTWEAEHATRWMLSHHGSCYLRLDKSAAQLNVAPGETFEMGRFRTVRPGSDVTLVATGGILSEALRAATQLSTHGVSARVVSAHTVKPIDAETIAECCAKTAGLVIIEEHNLDGGLGGAIAECCMDNGIAPKVFIRLGLRNAFSAVIGSQEYQRAAYGLDAEAIVGTVLKKFEWRRSRLHEAIS